MATIPMEEGHLHLKRNGTSVLRKAAVHGGVSPGWVPVSGASRPKASSTSATCRHNHSILSFIL